MAFCIDRYNLVLAPYVNITFGTKTIQMKVVIVHKNNLVVSL